MKRTLLLIGMTCLTASLLAAEKPARGDREIADYFRAETAKLSGRCLADVKTLDDWKSRREEYRRQLQEMLGLWPMPERTDLKPVVTGKLEQPDFTVEKLHFQALPDLYVTANLYLPKHLDKPVPAILLECGHLHMMTNGISLGNKTAYQHHGAWFAQNGYACLILDSLLLGEIQGVHTGTRDRGMWWWNSRGYTPAGVEAWFGIRALDYLATRPEVDINRVGVTGHSGGGSYSWTIAALDERVKVVAPLAGMTDLQNQIVDNRLDGHCDCMFFLNTHRWDFPQLAALVAPRPLLIGSEDKDGLFPLDGTMRIYEKTRRIYQLYSASSRLGLVVVEGPHADAPDFLVPVMRWFNRHLKGEDPPIETLAKKYFAPEQLRVFDHLPADTVNTNVQESFVPLAKPAPATNAAEERKQQQQAWLTALRERSFSGWPAEREPLEVKQAFSVKRDGVRLRAVDFTSQNLVRLRLYFVQPAGVKRPSSISLHVLDETEWPQWLAMMRAGFAPELAEELETASGDSVPANERSFDELKRKLASTKATLAWIAPRGVGLTAWNSAGKKESRIRRRFMLLGQTLDGMRVWDIRRAVQAVRTVPGLKRVSLSVRAKGSMGVNALYAALFEPGISRLELSQLPKSHVERPDYFNVLRIWDIPQALQTAADRMEVQL